MALEGFSEVSFTDDGVTRAVFRRGSGPGVVIMHEVPGITPAVAAFARRIADEGFTAVVPHLFGTPDKPFSVPYVGQQMLRACVSAEFSLLASRGASPITTWLRALCRSVHNELGGPGVGAIGMCITGNFALALMVDPAVMAPVLSQPSLPLPLTAGMRAGLHVSDEDLVVIKRRAADGVSVLGLRFTADPLCPKARFERLRSELGTQFEAIEIESSGRGPGSAPRFAHSVLTEDLVDREGEPTRAALDRVISFFKQRLL